MRLFSAHEAAHHRPAPPARCFSLELPLWAAPTAGDPSSGARGARKPGATRQMLRQMRNHPTGTER
jgi:hypothetical protein